MEQNKRIRIIIGFKEIIMGRKEKKIKAAD